MELAWNTQKNQMNDVKGKEREQDRSGKIKNEDINRERTKDNYDLVQSDKNLYQRVKSRVNDLKKEGSRVQKNSVVMYSNILTVPEEQAKKWGKEKTAAYFESCRDFFCEEFGKNNVVSAKVHLDESAPHMHLHFVPVNKENGRLQARVAMNKTKMNQIHTSLPKFLQERNFDVVRGSGKTRGKNIEDIHEYKEIQKEISSLKSDLKAVQAVKDNLYTITAENEEKRSISSKMGLKGKEAVVIPKENYDKLYALASRSVDHVESAKKYTAENQLLKSHIKKSGESLKKVSKSYDDLFDAYKTLKMENKLLHKTIDVLKERFKEKQQQFSQMVGHAKAKAINLLKMRQYPKSFFQEKDKNEQIGKEKFIQEQKKQQKIKSQNQELER
jgi:hypothetical protein